MDWTDLWMPKTVYLHAYFCSMNNNIIINNYWSSTPSTVSAGSDHYIHTLSVRPRFSKSTKTKQSSSENSGRFWWDCGLAEWIIDDSYLVLLFYLAISDTLFSWFEDMVFFIVWKFFPNFPVFVLQKKMKTKKVDLAAGSRPETNPEFCISLPSRRVTTSPAPPLFSPSLARLAGSSCSLVRQKTVKRSQVVRKLPQGTFWMDHEWISLGPKIFLKSRLNYLKVNEFWTFFRWEREGKE